MMAPFMRKITRLQYIIIFSLIGITWVLVYFIGLFLARQHQTTCVDNLHRISMALQQYISDYDDTWPTEQAYYHSPIFSRSDIHCPQAPPLPQLTPPLTDGPIPGYAYNVSLSPPLITNKKLAIEHPEITITVLDYTRGIPTTTAINPYADGPFPNVLDKGWKRHFGGGNYLFCDHHVRWYTEDKIRKPETEMCDNPHYQPVFCTQSRPWPVPVQ